MSTGICNSAWNITVWSKSRHQQEHDYGCFLTHCRHCLFLWQIQLLMNKPKLSLHNVKTATSYWPQTISAPFIISWAKNTFVPGIWQPLLPFTTEKIHKRKHGVSFNPSHVSTSSNRNKYKSHRPPKPAFCWRWYAGRHQSKKSWEIT